MSHNQLSSLPVYLKAMELHTLSKEIADFVTLNKDRLLRYRSNSLRGSIADSLLMDAVLIPEQIAEAEASDCYSIRLRNANFINIMIRNISSYCTGLERDGVREKEYLNLLRTEIRNFRSAFKEWRKSIVRGSGTAKGV